MGIGTDTGGSIRLPSSWCGIVGHKPTSGLVPYTGVVPMETTLDSAGPMTKTVKDCALLLEVGQAATSCSEIYSLSIFYFILLTFQRAISARCFCICSSVP